jgi:hypothetical protein
MTRGLGGPSAFPVGVHPETSTEHASLGVSFMLGHSVGIFTICTRRNILHEIEELPSASTPGRHQQCTTQIISLNASPTVRAASFPLPPSYRVLRLVLIVPSIIWEGLVLSVPR